MTNHPVVKLGRIAFRKIPFAHLDDVRADAKLSLERDLRYAPTPISGGMRKALHKEAVMQNALRFRPPRRYREPDLRKAYGLMAFNCRCGHIMFFDPDGDDWTAVGIHCDRCKRSYP